MKNLRFKDALTSVARQLVTPGKGILAADESVNTLASKFQKIKLENTAENRESYRSMLFTAPSLSKYISGIIQFEETLGNKLPSGDLLQNYLQRNQIIAGIKVDKGLTALSTDESLTIGLDGLEERCKSYYAQGCRFAKWRAVLKISASFPTDLAINENARALARYAFICQSNGLVPIVEPEVLAEGDHSIQTCAEVSKKVYAEVVHQLHKHSVILEGMLLKPNMITPGIGCKKKVTAEEIARMTVEVLGNTIPAAVPGVVFLSGGQSEEEASENLNALNRIEVGKRPWALSFSYGRALQASSISAWAGKDIKAGHEALLVRAKANALATLGSYEKEKNKGESLHISNYTY